MKTVSLRCVSSKETTLSKATKILSNFVSADNGAPVHIDRYLHKAYKAFNKLNQLHKERMSCQSHTTDDSGRVVVSVDVKSENEVPREHLQDENIDGKLIRNGNGSVSGGSEKHDKKDSKDKIEFGDREGDADGKLPKKEHIRIESGEGNEGGTEEGKKQRREKKDKNQEGEKNAMGQEQKKEVEKKLSNNGVKSENGGLVDPRDVKIKSKDKHEAGSDNKLNGEVKMEQKKRKNKDVEDKSGERSKKKTKKKHEG